MLGLLHRSPGTEGVHSRSGSIPRGATAPPAATPRRRIVRDPVGGRANGGGASRGGSRRRRACVESTREAVQVLDDAIVALQDASADWQRVLQEAQSKLTDDAQSTIRNEIAIVATRSIATAGVELRCEVDFVRERVRQAPPGWKIDRVSGPLSGVQTYTDSNHDPDKFDLGSGGPARQFEFVGDTGGDEAGTRTKVQVRFNRLAIEETRTENCVPARAVRSLRDKGLIGEQTFRRLSPRVERELRGLVAPPQ